MINRDGTETSLNTAITDTVSVIAKVTPSSSAGTQFSPSPNFSATAVTPDAITTPGPASRAIGLTVLRSRLMSVLIEASNNRIGRNKLMIKDESNPIFWGRNSDTANPAITNPVT